MNQIKSLSSTIIFCLACLVFSNEDATAQDVFKRLESHRYSIGYYGNNGIRPGIGSRTEFVFKDWSVERNSRRYLFGPKINRVHQKQLLFSKCGAFYVHPKSHVSFLRNWGLSYRKTRTKGWEYQFDLFPLGFQFFVMGETYEVSGDGTVAKKNLSISAYYTPGIAASFGKQFKNRDNALDAWFTRISINGINNYNNTWVPTANLEIGLRFKTMELVANAMEKNGN